MRFERKGDEFIVVLRNAGEAARLSAMVSLGGDAVQVIKSGLGVAFDAAGAGESSSAALSVLALGAEATGRRSADADLEWFDREVEEQVEVIRQVFRALTDEVEVEVQR